MNCGKRLEKGDTIGVVAPAGFSSFEKIDRAAAVLNELGYQVELGQSCSRRWHSFAGNDLERAGDLHNFFGERKIDAILCLRGGYGSLRLADKLDLDLIRANPKIFIGFSDITILHVIFNQQADLITFHGPMFASNIADSFDLITRASFERVLAAGCEPFLIDSGGESLQVLRGGTAEGSIIGGNLTTLLSMFGTPYEPDLAGKILFIEDIGEATYRIDRMLTQLILSGKLQGIQGIIIGDFKNCLPSSEEDPSLLEVFQDRLLDLGVPVLSNLLSGHCRPMLTLPLGVRARIDGTAPRIHILDKVVF